MSASDGRRNNGRPDQGLGQASLVVRGPSELMEAMARQASALGVPVVELWRVAARAYLAGVERSRKR